ncbi:MAG: hypothetical protein ACTHK6_11080 [Solirubrobacterales bacterium]
MIAASTWRMIALAIAGLLVAAAVAWLASDLASRQIGLASEPISAGDELAPAIARPHHKRHPGRSGHRKDQTTAPAPAAESPLAPESPPAAEPLTVPTEPPATEAPGGGDSGGGGAGSDGGGDD